MLGDDPQNPVISTALAWQSAARREALATLLALDAQMAGIASRVSEPMLGQIRLAWWRERLADDPGLWPQGEPLFARLRATWGMQAHRLSVLADGWEIMLGAEQLQSAQIAAFADARGAALNALGALLGATEGSQALATMAGRRWALADFAEGVSDAAESDAARALGTAMPPLAGPLPRSLRGLAVLDVLAGRALAHARPMLSTRSDALVAWRVGMTGR